VKFSLINNFKAVYRSLLHLSWIDKLVDNIKTLFVDLYGDQLKKPHTSIVEVHFDEYFDQQVRKLEKSALNKDKRTAESAALIEAAPLSVSNNLGDEPPPLPGLLARGWRLINNSIYIELTDLLQDNLGIITEASRRMNRHPFPHQILQGLRLLRLGIS
jgi:hypothetical protein